MSASKPMISDYDIRVRAYQIWERNGKPEARADDHWRQALAELEAERQATAQDTESVPSHPGVSNPPTRNIATPIRKSEPGA